jgi:hypothetical protein
MKISANLAPSLLLAGALAVAGISPVFAREEPPKAEIALAKDAIDQAQSNGATEAAPVELKAARDKYEQAQTMIAKEKRRDYPQARDLAQEAKVDADLADAKAAAAKAQKSLREVQDSIRALRHETERNPS